MDVRVSTLARPIDGMVSRKRLHRCSMLVPPAERKPSDFLLICVG